MLCADQVGIPQHAEQVLPQFALRGRSQFIQLGMPQSFGIAEGIVITCRELAAHKQVMLAQNFASEVADEGIAPASCSP
ncbi:hypothetical protein D3C85_1657490 [compost metagenome]